MLEIQFLDCSFLFCFSDSLDERDLDIFVYEKSVLEQHSWNIPPLQTDQTLNGCRLYFELELLLTEKHRAALFWIEWTLCWASFKHSKMEI